MTTPRWHDEPLLVGCYTDEDGRDGVLLAHATPGALAVGARMALRNASWLERLRPGRVLACSELPDSSLALLSDEDDDLVLVDRQPTGGADACHLAVSPDVRWVAVANYTSGQLSLFAAPQQDRLDPPLAVVDLHGSGPVTERQSGPHAHQCTWLDPRHLLVADLGGDQLHVYRVEDAGAQASVTELAPVELPAGTGPRHLVLRERGDVTDLAVCGELSGEVLSLRHRAETGQVHDWRRPWQLVQRVSGTRQVGASQPSGLRAWGERLVLANRGTDTVAVLGWDEQAHLELLDEVPCGGSNPRELVVHQELVWVANQDSGAVAVLGTQGDTLAVLDTLPVERPARLLFG